MCLRKLFKLKSDGRKHLLDIVDYIAGMAEMAGRTGILSLEEYWFDSKLPPDCGKLEKFLFMQLLKMLQSCVNESDVSYFAENYIASLEEKDASEQTLLALKIGAEGFIAVYRSESKAEIESRTIFRTCTILQIKQHFSSEMNFYIILSFCVCIRSNPRFFDCHEPVAFIQFVNHTFCQRTLF